MATILAMPDANLNAWWCRQLAAALVAGGCREVFLCPGNRNVPLAFALAAEPGLRVHAHSEERGAAFAALGAALASGCPTVVCTTSGTAVANCLPALCEADQGRIPVVLLAADRPPELHGCEAPQTMPQQGIFTAFLRAEAALSCPEASTAAAAAMQAEVVQAVTTADRASGPVQIDVPLRDPLPPLPDPAFTAPAEPPPPRAVSPGTSADGNDEVLARLGPAPRGLIVVGPRCPLPPEWVEELALATGYPVLADAPGALRHRTWPGLLGLADAHCAGPLGQERADMIIRLGPAPLARPVCEFLQRQDCPVLRIDDHPVHADFCHRRFELLLAPDRVQVQELARRLGPVAPSWRARWLEAERAAQTRRRAWLDAAAWGEATAAALVCAAAPGFDFLHLGNSLAVRHGNLHLAPGEAPVRVAALRGVNGIDGHLAAFFGQLLGSPGARGLCLCGDLSFLHDLPSLELAAQHQDRDAVLVVIDNGGGGIFDLLPVGGLPDYRRLIRTPSRLDIAAAAAAFGLPVLRCPDAAALSAALAVPTRGIRVLHVVVPPDSVAQQRTLLRELAGH